MLPTQTCGASRDRRGNGIGHRVLGSGQRAAGSGQRHPPLPGRLDATGLPSPKPMGRRVRRRVRRRERPR